MLSRINASLLLLAVLSVSCLASNDAVAGGICGPSRCHSPAIGRDYVHHASHHRHTKHISHEKVHLGVTGTFTHCGFRVKSVEHHSIAEQLGLHCGDVVVSINGYRLQDRRDFRLGLHEATACGHLKLRVEDAHHHQVFTLSARLFVDVPENLTSRRNQHRF